MMQDDPHPEFDPILLHPRRAGRPKSMVLQGVPEREDVLDEASIANMWEQLNAFAAPQPERKRRRIFGKQPEV